MGHLTPGWPRRILHSLTRNAEQKILPQARRYLKRHYHFTGSAGRSLRILSKASTATAASVDVGSTLETKDRAFGRWAQEPFVYPLGLHEGIKRHLVFIRYGGWERPHLKAWAEAHNIPEPAAYKNWAMMVYSRGRRKSAVQFLRMAIEIQRGVVADDVAATLLAEISGSAVGKTAF